MFYITLCFVYNKLEREGRWLFGKKEKRVWFLAMVGSVKGGSIVIAFMKDPDGSVFELIQKEKRTEGKRSSFYK